MHMDIDPIFEVQDISPTVSASDIHTIRNIQTYCRFFNLKNY